MPNEPPRLYCVIGGAGIDAQGNWKDAGCRCYTEQGTRYDLDRTSCEMIAIHGQYEPFRRASLEGVARADLLSQSRMTLA